MLTRRRSITEQSPGRLYGVLGHKIAYSASPEIFRRVFDALHWPAVYALLDLPPRRLNRFLRAASDAGIAGFNVTIPYKERIADLCDRLDASASSLGAVNTVAMENGRLIGYNTDSDGVRQSLKPYRRMLRGGQAVIFGAGGAARAVAAVLIADFHMARLTLVARSPQRGKRLLRSLAPLAHTSVHLDVLPWRDRKLHDVIGDAALLVNATPIGGQSMRGQSPISDKMRLPDSAIVFDLRYRPRVTRFLRQAQRARCQAVLNGWPMLIAQAETSFKIWTGRGFPKRLRAEILRGESHAV